MLPHGMLPSPPDRSILFTHAEIFALLYLLSHTPNLPAVLHDLSSKLQAAAVFPSLSHGQEVNPRVEPLQPIFIVFIDAYRTLAQLCHLTYSLAWLPQQKTYRPLGTPQILL